MQQPPSNYPYGGYGPPPGYPPPGFPPPKKKSNTVAIIVIVALVVIFVGASVGSALLKRSVASSAPPKVDYASIVATMAKIHDATPPLESLQEKDCPDDLAKPDGFYGVHIADWDFTARMSGPPVSYATSLRKDRPWDLSDDTVYTLHPIASGARMQDYEISNANNIVLGRYVLVVRAIEKHEPNVVRGGFEPGDWSGWAVLFDYKTAAPLCQWKFSGSNSDTVKHRDKGFFATSTNEALMDDLRDNVRDEASKSLTRKAPPLSTVGF